MSRHISSQRYIGADRRMARRSVWALIATFLVFIAIAYATLCPIELRPHLGGANEERFGAYFVFGILASVSFPRRANALVFAIAVIAFALEAGQLMVPGRDAAFTDACVKAAGGVWGVFIVEFAYATRRRFFPPTKYALSPDLVYQRARRRG